MVTSQYLRDQCLSDFHLEAHIVRMGGLAFDNPEGLFRVRSVLPGTQLRLLSVCRIEDNKRIDWILHSLAVLQATTPPLSLWTDWRLDLAGSGPQLASLTQLAAQLGIAGRVHFHGFVPDRPLQSLYDQAHLFLMPAIQGYGIPAIEALQRGIPVLLHRDSGVSDILLDTPWATVFTGGSDHMTAALAHAIDGVLDGRHHHAHLPHLPTEDSGPSRSPASAPGLPRETSMAIVLTGYPWILPREMTTVFRFAAHRQTNGSLYGCSLPQIRTQSDDTVWRCGCEVPREPPPCSFTMLKSCVA